MAILADSLSSRSVSDYQLWLTLKMATAVEKKPCSFFTKSLLLFVYFEFL